MKKARKIKGCKHKAKWIIAAVCPICLRPQTTIKESPYGTHEMICKFLKSEGFEIVAGNYERPKIDPCIDNQEHDWDGRWVVGITFRRCNNCGLVQRKLYEPYFKNYQLGETSYELPPHIDIGYWNNLEPCSAEDDKPGTIQGWE